MAENPIFEALSYCWGDRLDVRDILVDGRLRSVTKNLHAALQRLRYEDRSRQVWADAICINQADDIEKTHQVNMMKNIFTQATSTTLFIGDYEADAREPMDYPPFSKDIKPDSRAGVETACALIRKLAENKHIYYLDWENDPLYLPSNSFRIWYHATECIRSLVMQPWWSRIWTVQETVLPAKPTVQYGAITLSWKLFGQAVDNLLGHFDRRCCNMKARPIVSEEPPIVTFYNKACSIERRRSQPLPLSTTLSLFRDRIASDPRDKVYGVLGLARDEAVRAGIEADYTIGPVDSYIQVTRKLIQQQDDLSPLGQVQHFHGEHLAGLPSWTPDFLSVGDWGYYSLALTYSHAYWKPLDFTRFRLDSGEDASVLKVSGIVDAKKVPTAQVARKHAIARGTLRHRQKGGTNAREAKISTQRLSPDQEDDLINWIINKEEASRAPTKKNIREFAQLMASVSGEEQPIGHNWVNRFIQRHEEVKTKFSRSTEAVRTREATEENLEQFYDRLDTQIKKKGVGWTRIHNIDEHGVAEGETKAGKVVGTSLTSLSTVSESDSRTWVSIIEAIAANGDALTPVVIFTGLNLQGQWFPDLFPDWKYDCTESGWSNSLIFRKWFLEVYLPETKPKTGLWRILILDGHKSHMTMNIRNTFKAASIYPTLFNRVKGKLVATKRGPSQNLQPLTPKKRRIQKGQLWYTPKNSREVKSQANLVKKDLDSVNRGLRTLAHKAGKEMDRKNTMITALTYENEYLKKKLESQEPTGRKAVDYDPNERFARIPEIAAAHYKAAAAADRYKERHAPNLMDESLEMASIGLDNMQFDFQV
ncbi:hypothetical protein ACJ41O_006273 [Fusarium nematophilum]